MPPKKKPAPSKSDDVARLQQETARAWERRRDQLCRPPLYPGKPTDYRLVPERCQRAVPGIGQRPRVSVASHDVGLWASHDDVRQAQEFLSADRPEPAQGSTSFPENISTKTLLKYIRIQEKVIEHSDVVMRDALVASQDRSLLKRIDGACKKHGLGKLDTIWMRVLVCKIVSQMKK